MWVTMCHFLPCLRDEGSTHLLPGAGYLRQQLSPEEPKPERTEWGPRLPAMPAHWLCRLDPFSATATRALAGKSLLIQPAAGPVLHGVLAWDSCFSFPLPALGPALEASGLCCGEFWKGTADCWGLTVSFEPQPWPKILPSLLKAPLQVPLQSIPAWASLLEKLSSAEAGALSICVWKRYCNLSCTK